MDGLAAPTTEQEKMCQHIDAHRAFIQRDLTAAARSAGRYQEGTRAYNRAVEAIRKLQGELAKHKEVVRISGPKCSFCLERD